MKKILLAGILATSLATPALAQEFAGPRIGVEVGAVDDDFLGTAKGTYGAVGGYDFDLGKVVVGGTVSYTRQFDDDGSNARDITVAGRVGAKLTPRSLLYGSAGYTNIDVKTLPAIDGVKFGVGFEHLFGKVYGNLETRYANYERGIEGYQTVVGVGVRF